jgi:hypothetical protein
MMPAELWEFGTDSQISLAYSRRRRSGPFHGAPYVDGMFCCGTWEHEDLLSL